MVVQLQVNYYLDGLCCEFGEGYFKVISQDNGVLFDGTGIEFEASTEGPFALSAVVSTKDYLFSNLKIFPNPIIDELTIELPEDVSKIQSITLFDLQGKIIFNSVNVNEAGGQINLNLSTLHSGLYLLQIRLEDGTIAQKKIIKG